MKSMTGFGRDEAETDLGKIVVEGRSENHRFLDINFQIPEALSAAEPNFTEIVKKFIVRGKVRINIAVEGLRNKSTTVDIGLAKESLKTLEKMKKELGLKEPVELQHLLMIRDFFSSEVKPSINKKHIAKVGEALLGTVNKLDQMRKAEGKKLEKDLRQRTSKIETLVRKIESKREDFMKDFSNKLRERIQELLEDIQIDEAKLNQEIVFLAERSDITEEIIRLGAHISKLKETFGKDGSIGRELDFLLQEMNREANTISAKSKDAEISHFVVELRSEMEKIREQIQNIE